MQLATISGAGTTHPYAWALPAAPAPRPALTPAPAQLPERDLPLAIQRACTRILFWRAGPFEALAARDRAVLAEVIRCVDRKHPEQAVHVRRDTLAEREGCWAGSAATRSRAGRGASRWAAWNSRPRPLPGSACWSLARRRRPPLPRLAHLYANHR